MKKLLSAISITLLILSTGALAEIKVGQTPSLVEISGDNGGLVKDDGKWSSTILKGKVFALFYVDPDESDLNAELSAALKEADFPGEKFASVAIINMAATWLPNFAISSKLESKQKEFPRTIYVKDLEKVMVKKWQLTDDGYDVVLFGKDGKVLFRKAGKFAKKEIDTFLGIIRKNL